jgi:hypothetical protein
MRSTPYAKASGHGHLESAPDALGLAVNTVEKLHYVRLQWWHLWRVAHKVGAATPKHPVIFECVGVAAAFDALGDPEAHAKILIDPKSDAAAP